MPAIAPSIKAKDLVSGRSSAEAAVTYVRN